MPKYRYHEQFRDRRRRTVTPLFSRKDRRRMQFLLFAFGVVAASMLYLRRPGSVDFLMVGQEVNTVVDPNAEKAEEKPTNFRFAQIEAPSDQDPAAPAVAPKKNVENPDVAPAKPAYEQVNPLRLHLIDECMTPNPDYLAEIKDFTKTAEFDPFYQLLCVASTIPPEVLAKEARRDVFFAQLYNNPKEYRGVPIRIEGLARRITEFNGLDRENPYGLPHYYEAWVYTPSQWQDPIRVYAASLGEGLEPGEDLRVEVKIDAFFFKIISHKAGDEQFHGAPMLIGYQLNKIVRPPSTLGRQAMIAGLIFLGLTALAGLYVWYMGRRDEKLAQEMRRQAVGNGPLPSDSMGAMGQMGRHPSDPLFGAGDGMEDDSSPNLGDPDALFSNEPRPLTGDDYARLGERKRSVEDQLNRFYGDSRLTGLRGDLPLLQRLIDERRIPFDDHDKWTSVGAAFGEIFVGEKGCRWVVADTGSGMGPALENRGVILDPLTLIPFEMALKGSDVKLEDLFDTECERLV